MSYHNKKNPTKQNVQTCVGKQKTKLMKHENICRAWKELLQSFTGPRSGVKYATLAALKTLIIIA